MFRNINWERNVSLNNAHHRDGHYSKMRITKTGDRRTWRGKKISLPARKHMFRFDPLSGREKRHLFFQPALTCFIGSDESDLLDENPPRDLMEQLAPRHQR